MALSATGIVEVDAATGNDNNGGMFDPSVASAGTDYTYGAGQTAISIPDLTTDFNDATLVSATRTFVAADVGNTIQILTGLTAGFYSIRSVSGGIATLDRAAGLTNSTGTATLGGSLASPGKAAGMGLVAGNTIHIKKNASAYSCSSTANIANGKVSPSVQSQWIGYNSTRGDLNGPTGLWSSNMPSLKATSNSMTICNAAANDVSFENIEADGDKSNRSSTICFSNSSVRCRFVNCRAKNPNSQGWANAAGYYSCWFCEATGCGAVGFQGEGSHVGCIARGGTLDGFRPNAAGTIYASCVAYGNTLDGFGVSFSVHCFNCSSYGNGGDGFDLDTVGCYVANCISYGNTGYGFQATASRPQAFVVNCAGGSNGLGNFHGTFIPAANQINFVTLTADPFTTAASLDFSLNNTAGGGAACRNAGAGNFPGSATTSYNDIGAARHVDPTIPAIGNVRSGTTYGVASGSTGTLTLPSAGDVRSAIQFGAAGTEFTGTLDITADNPSSGNTMGIGF